MLTRGAVTHQYYPEPGPRISHNGAVKVNVVNNIPQSWAITRPGSYYNPSGAPYYCHQDSYYDMPRGGALAIRCARPSLEMDPSDDSTWQRQYVFTQ